MSLERIENIAEMRRRVAEARRGPASIGLVPTMGALHRGHTALIEQAREQNGYVVVSIFVNPIQFDRPEDLDRYPRTLEADEEVCRTLGVNAIFAPSAREMYPAPQLTFVEVGTLAERLCGEFRPGHFRGVATVVTKLLNIVQPDRAYFGEKDAQQLAVIERLVADLNLPVTIIPVPTVRESDGLALSSRNQRLSTEERRIAPGLYRALLAAAERIGAGGTPEDARDVALSVLGAEPRIRVEYFELVDPATMQPVDRPVGSMRAAAAVWLGTTRLIDNVLIPVSPSRRNDSPESL